PQASLAVSVWVVGARTVRADGGDATPTAQPRGAREVRGSAYGGAPWFKDYESGLLPLVRLGYWDASKPTKAGPGTRCLLENVLRSYSRPARAPACDHIRQRCCTSSVGVHCLLM